MGTVRRCARIFATDKVRPCTSAEVLAYLYLNKNNPKVVFEHGDTDQGEQTNFVDQRETQSKSHKRLLSWLLGDLHSRLHDKSQNSMWKSQ